MKREPLIRLATDADIAAMVPRLRTKDAVDVMTGSRHTLDNAIRASLEHATHAWVWEVDGEPACMFGVTLRSLLGGRAIVWIFTTDLVEKHRRMFWEGSKRLLALFLERYGTVEGYCDGRFLQSMQWLRKLGFDLKEPVYAFGVPFHHFEMTYDRH